uniref:Uncharacterized protein n=1 Tax=Anguilla anguilla TaxID=7936 RepID=A0A0E9XI03_ANGAN
MRSTRLYSERTSCLVAAVIWQ